MCVFVCICVCACVCESLDDGDGTAVEADLLEEDERHSDGVRARHGAEGLVIVIGRRTEVVVFSFVQGPLFTHSCSIARDDLMTQCDGLTGGV